MSVFRNIRIYPNHGTRRATITWDIIGAGAGDVFVAFSPTGTKGTWSTLNPDTPAPSAAGFFEDTTLFLNAGAADGFYRLLLTSGATDYMSEPFRIMGDISRQEYGVIRAIIHREYTMMRTSQGYPVWHCIPREHGTPSLLVDPATGKQDSGECAITDPDKLSYGLAFQGGFYPPILTWMRVLAHNEGLKDDPDSFSPEDMVKMSVRLMAFPRPARHHMIIDPATDRRFLISDEIKPYSHRGIFPIAYEATVEHLGQSDERYKFVPPFVDTRAYRNLHNWRPTP